MCFMLCHVLFYFFLLCVVMLCCVMLCVMLCFMLCYVSCCFVLKYASCHVMLCCYFMLQYVMMCCAHIAIFSIRTSSRLQPLLCNAEHISKMGLLTIIAKWYLEIYLEVTRWRRWRCMLLPLFICFEIL